MSRTFEGLSRYPDEPGWKEPTTSRDAAAKIRPSTNALYADILREIDAAGDRGLTSDEAAAKLGQSVLLIRPRFSELGPRHQGKIEKTGERRKNESGLVAAAWRIRRTA